MNAEHLVALANARGVDLKHAVGATIETRGIARQRDRTKREVELGLDVTETASGRESRSYRRPAWSMSEFAQAAAAGGIKGAPWAAVRYSIAGDASCQDELHHSLFGQALQFMRRDNWAFRVPGLDGQPKCYLEDLSDLVLTEDAYKHYFAGAPLLFSIFMNVSNETWSRSLEWQYATLKAKYATWIEIGLAGIRRGLRGGD
jgi:hypothetical protein